MLTTTGTRGQRAFWAALGFTWLVLLDREHVFDAYRRGMPGGVSVAYVRGVVTVSGIMLAVGGILVTTLGCIRIWRELWASP